MSDIVSRLSYTHIPCSCFSRSADYIDHDKFCTHRVVREGEAEIQKIQQIKMLLQQSVGIINELLESMKQEAGEIDRRLAKLDALRFVEQMDKKHGIR